MAFSCIWSYVLEDGAEIRDDRKSESLLGGW